MTHDRSDVMSSNQWSRTACELAAEIDAALVVVETNFGGDMALLAIRTAWDLLRREHAEQHPGEPNPYADRLPPRVVAVRAKQGKLLRADPIAQQMAQDRIRFGQYLPLVEEEWATWQPDDPESPGRIDASAYLAYALLRVPGAGERIATAHETRRDQTAQGGWTARRIERRQ
jgi:phage terminase large subunit-like protein